MEEALVYEVRATGLLLFVPRFHLRGAVRLVDRAGRITPPANSDADLDADVDAFAAAARRALRLDSGAPADADAGLYAATGSALVAEGSLVPSMNINHSSILSGVIALYDHTCLILSQSAAASMTWPSAMHPFLAALYSLR